MIKLLIGMLKMKSALKKLEKEDLTTYPEGYTKFGDALGHMGAMGDQLKSGLLMFLTFF